MRKAPYKVFAMASASHRLQQCLCVPRQKTKTALFRINVEERHVVGTESPVIVDLPVVADARSQRTANVSEGEGFWTPNLAGRSCAMRGRRSKVSQGGNRGEEGPD